MSKRIKYSDDTWDKLLDFVYPPVEQTSADSLDAEIADAKIDATKLKETVQKRLKNKGVENANLYRTLREIFLGRTNLLGV